MEIDTTSKFLPPKSLSDAENPVEDQNISALEIKENSSEVTSITLEAAQVDYNPGELAVENSSEVTSITLEAAGELAVEVKQGEDRDEQVSTIASIAQKRAPLCDHQDGFINTMVAGRSIIYRPYWTCDECNKMIDAKDLQKANLPDHICLLCGYQTCDEHGRSHYEALQHSLSLKQHSKNIFCFKCNDYVENEDVTNLKDKIFIQQEVLHDERERTQPFKKYKSASNTNCFCCGVCFGWLWNRRKQCSSCLRPVCYRELSERLCKLCVETSVFKGLEKMQAGVSVVGVNSEVKDAPIVKGIKNIENTSSLSVLLQNILHFPDVVRSIMLYDASNIQEASVNSHSVLQEVIEIFKEFMKESSHYIVPNQLCDLLHRRYVNLGWRMRDLVTVLEVWTTLLDVIDEEQQRGAASTSTQNFQGSHFMKNYFSMHMRHKRMCNECKHCMETIQNQTFISIPVTMNEYTVNQETVNEREDREIIKFKKLVPKLINTAFSLENRLLQYFNIKLSDVNNMAICEKCSDIKGVDFRSMFTHQYLIDKLPNILIFHLTRFCRNGRKDNHHISFPLILDMGPYCCDSIYDKCTDGSNQILYNLSGVIVHNGNANNSHYTTYVKQKCTQSEVVNLNDFCSDKYSIDAAYTGKWFYIDDCAVVPISLQEVIKCQANMIFYERLCTL